MTPRLSRSSGVIVPVTFRFQSAWDPESAFRARPDHPIDRPQVVAVGIERGLDLRDDRLGARPGGSECRRGAQSRSRAR